MAAFGRKWSAAVAVVIGHKRLPVIESSEKVVIAHGVGDLHFAVLRLRHVRSQAKGRCCPRLSSI